MKLWIWRHFGFRLPADWEMLQYSLKIEEGRCAFADRYGFRFEMTWRQVQGPPDFDRMLSDYLAKLSEEGMQDGRRLETAGWPGLTGRTDGDTITRYGRFADDASCLVEVVFPWPEVRDEDLETQVLQSFHEVGTAADAGQRWRAFGMDVQVPAHLALASCQAEPARVEWQFKDKRGRTMTRFLRQGMVEAWMSGSLQTWLEDWVKPTPRSPARWQHEDRSGHAVTRLEGHTAGEGWLQRTRPVRAEAWICPADSRLYSWVTEDAAGVTGHPLMCCRT